MRCRLSGRDANAEQVHGLFLQKLERPGLPLGGELFTCFIPKDRFPSLSRGKAFSGATRTAGIMCISQDLI